MGMRRFYMALFPALSLMLAGAFPVNAADGFVTVEFGPAAFKGKPSCGSKYPGTTSLGPAFLHAWNKTCWSCPKSYNRTVDPNVAGKKACRLPGQTLFKTAKKHRKNTKIGQGCPSNQFWDIKGGEKGLGACYSCASGYARSVNSVTSAKACVRKLADKHAAGKKRGTPGCPEGTFRNGLLDQCYSCPEGYQRSLAVGKDLSKNKQACFKAKVDVGALVNPKFVAWAKEEVVALREEYAPVIAKALVELKKINQPKNRPGNQFMTPGKIAQTNRKLANGMINWTKNHQKKAGLDVRFASAAGPSGLPVTPIKKNNYLKTISLGWTTDASFGVGGTATSPMVAWNISDTKKGGKATLYVAMAWSVGITAGMDVAPELGFWTDANTELDGDSHGVIGGLSVKGGAAISFWFSYGKKMTGKKPRFLGLTIIPQLGISGELEYTRGMTDALVQ